VPERLEPQSVLAGKTLLVTRAREQAEDLCRELERRGARTLPIAMLDFALPDDTESLDTALRSFDRFDWWLLTSRNTVLFAAARAAAMGLDLRERTVRLRVAAVGETTAQCARAHGISVQVVATKHTGAALAEELGEHVRAKRVLLLRSDLADGSLPGALRAHGAVVSEAVAYCTVPAGEREDLKQVDWSRLDGAIFFSPSALKYFEETLGTVRAHEVCGSILLAAAGPTTAKAVREAGFRLIIQANDSSTSAVIQALEEYWSNTRAADERGMARI